MALACVAPRAAAHRPSHKTTMTIKPARYAGLALLLQNVSDARLPSYATSRIGISGCLKSVPLANVIRGQSGTSAVRCCRSIETVRLPTSQLIPLSVQVALRGSSQCLH